MRSLAFFVVTLYVTTTVRADIYLHNPRGSNNRLNEPTADRDNANRAFDSQNNDRGGYNVGDRTNEAFDNAEDQYQMKYFASGPGSGDVSSLVLEWTNQHGCGKNDKKNNRKVNCDINIQYMLGDHLRDGINTQTQDFTDNKANDVDDDKVYFEPHEWYSKCNKRSRNKGLFTADQNLGGDTSIYTRQNAGGTRRGYECPEERDYYPYWQPTPWIDIAILTNNTQNCKALRAASFNTQAKGECVDDPSKITEAECGSSWTKFYNFLELTDDTTRAQCKARGNKYRWAVPYIIASPMSTEKRCMLKLKRPQCKTAPYSRPNHNGNGKNGLHLSYTWNLPHFPSMTSEDDKKAFILRIRYNISTNDYDPHTTDSNSNGGNSPVTNNPQVNVQGVNLQLAINTAQFGRTFQDRSHVSYFVKRPDGVTGKIKNVSVRGKRGNIVQVYPGVEYDFTPSKLVLKQADYVHFQWTGSNTHYFDGPGNDAAGQGQAGSDRSNMIGMDLLTKNYPNTNLGQGIFSNMEVKWQAVEGKSSSSMNANDIGVKFLSGGYYDCRTGCPARPGNIAAMNNELDNAYASFGGMLVRFRQTGTFFYMCTRNNQFTNRSQKGEIVVE